MTQVFSGLMLFVLVTVLASGIVAGVIYAIGYGSFVYNLDSLLMAFALFAGFALASSIVLVVLAWRGRREPLLDGTLTLNVLLIAFNLAWFGIALSQGPSPYPDSMPMFYAMLASGLLVACLIPAHIIAVLCLSRTPLLRGLVQKQRRPAAASP